MFLKQRHSDDLVEVLNTAELFDPFCTQFTGRLNCGEDLPEASQFQKDDVVFASGENLPDCWKNANYRETEKHHAVRIHHH